jgi:uncharacterized protein (DUF4415 family)
MAKHGLLPSVLQKVAFSRLSSHGDRQSDELFQRESPIRVKESYMRKKSHAAVDRPRTDWARVDSLTDEEIEAAVRDDPDAAPIVDDQWFASARLVMPQPKEQISIRLDRDVLEHFRRYPRYQTRINAILRAAMEHDKKAG